MNNSTRATLEIIRTYDGACPRDFANNDIYRYGARIYDLRQAGYSIIKTPCKKHHHTRRIYQYRLIGRK